MPLSILLAQHDGENARRLCGVGGVFGGSPALSRFGRKFAKSPIELVRVSRLALAESLPQQHRRKSAISPYFVDVSACFKSLDFCLSVTHGAESVL